MSECKGLIESICPKIQWSHRVTPRSLKRNVQGSGCYKSKSPNRRKHLSLVEVAIPEAVLPQMSPLDS